MPSDKPKKDVVAVRDTVRYVLPDGESRDAEVTSVYNPGVYPRGGAVALRLRPTGPTDCLGGELPRDATGKAQHVVVSRDAKGAGMESLRLVNQDGYLTKRGVAYMPKKSGVPGTWHFPSDD